MGNTNGVLTEKMGNKKFCDSFSMQGQVVFVFFLQHPSERAFMAASLSEVSPFHDVKETQENPFSASVDSQMCSV